MHVHYMQPTHFNVDVPKPNRTKSSNEFRFPLVGVSVCVFISISFFSEIVCLFYFVMFVSRISAHNVHKIMILNRWTNKVIAFHFGLCVPIYLTSKVLIFSSIFSPLHNVVRVSFFSIPNWITFLPNTDLKSEKTENHCGMQKKLNGAA